MEKNEENKRENKKEFNTGWSKAGKVAIFFAILNPFFIMLVSKTSFSVEDISNLGTVGDFLGGTTVGFLSLASIFFIIHTIAIQGEELRLTREEFHTGNTTARVQQIDNAFFNMLSLHHQIVNNIKINVGKDTRSGREAISILRDICKQSIAKHEYFLREKPSYLSNWKLVDNFNDKMLDKFFAEADILTQEQIDEVYMDFHNEYGNDIGHYIRNNYRIVKFIVNNVASDEEEQKRIEKATGREPIIGDKRYYLGMLRAQWSNAEFELILINSLYKENHKFKDLILKYDVLDMEETNDNEKSTEIFRLKDSMDKFKAFKQLIEVRK